MLSSHQLVRVRTTLRTPRYPLSTSATASYRLLPEIVLTRPVRGGQASRLAKCFSKGVIKLERGEDGEKYAVVSDPRRDTCSREVLRHEVCGSVECFLKNVSCVCVLCRI